MLPPNQSRETEGWSLLRNGQPERALSLLGLEFDEKRNTRASLGYGAALMWTGQQKAAVEHFEQAIEKNRTTKNSIGLSESQYSLTGAARWCLGDYAEAVKLWSMGIQAPYATYGVGLECPLLLVLVSIIAPALCDDAKALETLNKRASDPRVHDYPGTLAQFVAGIIDDEALEKSLTRRAPRSVECHNRDHSWKADFYRAALKVRQSSITRDQFTQISQAMTEPSKFTDLDAEEFWWLTRTAEFYLAQHEATLK